MKRSAPTQPTRRPRGTLAAALERRRARRLAAAASLAARRVDPAHAHVAVRDATRCASECPDRTCTFLCPAAVFHWRDGAPLPLAGAPLPPAGGPPLLVRYDLCVECGACRIFCPLDNIDLRWPRGGYGIQHRFG